MRILHGERNVFIQYVTGNIIVTSTASVKNEKKICYLNYRIF